MSTDSVRVDVKSSRIRNVASCIVRHNRDVIAYLVILWITRLRIKRVAYRNIRRPGGATVCAPGIEQLAINVVDRVTRVQPHHINSSIGRYSECAEDVPLVRVYRVVIDSLRSAKGGSVVGATREHHVSTVVGTELFHACHHVDVIVSRRPGLIDRDERLSTKSYVIDSALNEVAV